MTAARAGVTATMRDVGDVVAAGAAIRLVPIGELDLASAPMFLGSLAAALDRRPASIVIDCRRLAFIDARTVAAIATASTRMRTWGGTLEARHAERGIRRMFELCGLAHLVGPRARGTDTPHSRALLPGLPARMTVAANARERQL